MPILCPGGSLWRLGKHVRQGGQRAGPRNDPTTPRPVHTRGTLAHPFSQQQVDLGPMMSPGSVGGVYLGPESNRKDSSPTHEKKLAEIRSPTDYYTNGDVFIGQGELNSRETKTIDPVARSHHPQHNDTLNPDGTLASIVFFEETFMSAKVSSPQKTHPTSYRSKSTNGTFQLSKQSTVSPTKQQVLQDANGYREERSPRGERTVPSDQTSPDKASYHGYKNIFPTWVGQRRCLPTLDDIDFDQIDLISLHSLPTSEGKTVTSPEERDKFTATTTPWSTRDAYEPTAQTGCDHLNNNWMESKEEEALIPRSNAEILSKVTNDCRAVLGDLTNTKNSAAKTQARSSTKSAFRKIPRRMSVGERRSRRNRKGGKERSRSSSRECLAKQRDDHTYVNVDYIAGITAGGSHPQGDQGTTEDHTYQNVWFASSTNAREHVRDSRQDRPGLPPKGFPRCHTAMDAMPKKSPKTFQKTQQKLKQGGSGYSKLVEEADSLQRPYSSIIRSNGNDRTAWENDFWGQGKVGENVGAAKELCTDNSTPRVEKLSSTSSWESATNSHSTDGEECAAILYKGGALGECRSTSNARRIEIEAVHTRHHKLTGKVRTEHRGSDNEQAIGDHNTDRRDTGKLVDKPSYIGNSIKSARIVRTTSIEDEVKQLVSDTTSNPQPDGKKTTSRFVPKKSGHVETRRSLPAPSSLDNRTAQITPQRRSATNVRVVEAKLAQKQKRKIRRTIEGDEILEALLMQDQETQQLHGENEAGPETTSYGAKPFVDTGAEDETSRVQKIINDWNECSKGIASRLQSTHSIGSHVHVLPDRSADDLRAHTFAPNHRRHETKSSEPAVRRVKKDGTIPKAGHAQNTGQSAFQHPVAMTKEAGTQAFEVSRSEVRHIPSLAASAGNRNARRSASPSVIEIYIATQPYAPVERDEVETQPGEILVVNSAMQRENDWMWVYVPRTDHFGYVPAFAARPLEFQYSQD
ncbi:uncharacterized protein [Diadema setosum]|uniref:uncharacterized protein n=1 Tax=Diadema setosum TaxID=31175 RepID=UPI003B3B81F5